MKKLVAVIAVLLLCLSFTACGEVTYENADERGVIKYNLCEGFETRTQHAWEAGTYVQVEAPSENGPKQIYISVRANSDKIYDTTIRSGADTLASYVYAEDIEREPTKFFDMEGEKVTLTMGDDPDGKKRMGMVLASAEEGQEKGYLVRVETEYYEGDEKRVEEQLKNFTVDREAYDYTQGE